MPHPRSHAVTSPPTVTASIADTPAANAAKDMRSNLQKTTTTAEDSSPLPPPGKHQKRKKSRKRRLIKPCSYNWIVIQSAVYFS